MMKKIIIFLFFITIVSLPKGNKVVIPKESIRFRIIANSNNEEDQKLKWQINKELIPILHDITQNASDIEEMRININNNVNRINNITDKYTNDYRINYGLNYFPEKEYSGVLYPEGDYESLVITLGDGLGDNWWCVLFPPLCLMEAKKTDYSDAQYKLFVKEAINKYF